MTSTDTTRAIEAVWRIESARLIAGLARIVGDIGLAEELAQDALVAALEQWPVEGIPAKPGAWLMSTAKHRGIDQLRRRSVLQRKHDEIGRDLDVQQRIALADLANTTTDDVGDDLLRLIFTACHPILTTDARVALTLRLLGGLTTDEIAQAYLVPESTIAQRIVRAKRTLSEAHVPFEVPHGADLSPRLASVLDVVYLIFNEGYAATTGSEWMRPGLCDAALRLGRMLEVVAPSEPEVHGLAALMEIQASRLAARVGPTGEPVRLLEQDRGRWDKVLIRRGLLALDRAERQGGPSGPYTLQAAIAACHARARRPEDTDWPRIVALYDALAQLTPSPSWTSTGPSRSGWRTGRRRGSMRSSRSPPPRRCATTICCRPSAATSSSRSAGTRTPPSRSGARPTDPQRAGAASAARSGQGRHRRDRWRGSPPASGA